jgi:hypothetical protein
MTSVFVGNLPIWVTSQHLRDWLSEENLKFVRVHVLAGKRCGFVDAPTDKEAERIIARYNHAPLDGRMLRAHTAHPRSVTEG